MLGGTRAFIAVELSEEVKTELVRLQTVLKRSVCCPVRWVVPENTHLTLCFLGEINQTQIEAVQGVVAEIGTRFAPLRMEMAQPGAFPNLAQPQTLWIGLGGEQKALSRLQHCLEVALQVVGYKADDRLFSPHLTVARVQSEAAPDVRRDLGEALRNFEVAPMGVAVTELCLMKSVLRPTGAVYTCLDRVKLSGTGAASET